MSGTWTLWASHERVRNGEWIVLIAGLAGRDAAKELAERQDRVRRNKQPCRFRALPEGEVPT